MFGFIGVFFEFLVDDVEKIFDFGPFLVGFEYFFDELSEEALLDFIDDVDVGELAFKRVLAIDDFVEDTAERKAVWLGVDVEVCVVVKYLGGVVFEVFLYVAEEQFVALFEWWVVSLWADILGVDDDKVFVTIQVDVLGTDVQVDLISSF